MRWRTALVLAALGPFGFGLQALATASPAATEWFYARGLFPAVQRAQSAFVSWSPVSVGESLLIALVTLLLLRSALGIVACCRRRRRLRNLLGHAFAQLAALAGVLFLSFQLLWALNHARLPLSTQLDLHPAPAEPAALARVAQRLAERAAAARPAGFDACAPLPEGSVAAIADVYDAAGRTWPALAGPRPALRTAWISRLMTLGSITGIYSPFTGEPHVNGELPPVLLLAVACHEVAHQRGYAREDEANFLAWWVGSRSREPAVAYACELFAWRTAMAQLWHVDFTAWQRLRRAAPPELLADDEVIAAFWRRQPKTVTKVLTTITTATNDLYLKSSGHRDGVRSYGRMVDLLIAALDG